MTKRFGFTLAEVLITLGIIGVVAAMTMPTLINQTNGAQYKAAYKKALSAISQGITLNVALDDKSFADASVDSDTAATAESVTAYLKGRMNVVNIVSATPYPTGAPTDATVDDEKLPTGATKAGAAGIWMFFNDGSMFALPTAAKACTEDSPCAGYIDVNGIKGPNKVVRCTGTFTAASGTTPASCTEATPTDIYPVLFYDQTILPKSAAGKAVLYGK